MEAVGGLDICLLGFSLGCVFSRVRECRVIVRFFMWAFGLFGKTVG